MAHVLTAAQQAAIASSFSPDPQVWATNLATGETVQLPMIDGTVVLDGGSTERVTLTGTVAGEMAPTAWSSLLIPDDCRLTVMFGLGIDPDVKVATAWLDRVAVRRPEHTVTIEAYSRATRVSQAGFPKGGTYTGNSAQAAEKVVEAALGKQVTVVNQGVTGPTVSDQDLFTGDPWEAVEALMDSAGAEAFFDIEDRLVMRPVPRADPPVKWTLATGEGGTIIDYEVSLTRAPNVVRMRFSADGQADVYATATATGNAAPTGPYGYYRTDIDRDGKVTQAQANTAATEYLTRAGGLMRTITLTAVPHPGIEVGDAIGITFVNGATEVHRVTRVELPLTMGEPMRVETRSLPWT